MSSHLEKIRFSEIALSDISFEENTDINTFMIIDACSEPSVPPKMQSLGPAAESLWQGDAQRDFWSIAPYLAKGTRGLLEWAQENLESTTWGVLVESSQSSISLRRHLRTFLSARLPDGRETYFRFYDPRVLPDFVETCPEDDLNKFFRPIHRLYCPVGVELFSCMQLVNPRSR